MPSLTVTAIWKLLVSWIRREVGDPLVSELLGHRDPRCCFRKELRTTRRSRRQGQEHPHHLRPSEQVHRLHRSRQSSRGTGTSICTPCRGLVLTSYHVRFLHLLHCVLTSFLIGAWQLAAKWARLMINNSCCLSNYCGLMHLCAQEHACAKAFFPELGLGVLDRKNRCVTCVILHSLGEEE